MDGEEDGIIQIWHRAAGTVCTVPQGPRLCGKDFGSDGEKSLLTIRVSELGDQGKTACFLVLSFGLLVNGSRPGRVWAGDLLSPCCGHGRLWPSRRGNRKKRKASCSCVAPTLLSAVHRHHRPQPALQPPSVCVGRCQPGWELCSVTCVRTGSMADVCQYLISLAPKALVPPHHQFWPGGNGIPNSCVLCACVHGAHAWRPSRHCW